ncbi:hypothetical protein [Mucilaginibacter sp.]|uniref:hypothetical protein n=1 Tax=Mucilaginibacter sp. TaxID=1882438 RepID=UPI00262565A5|nr:hypothetical protein [Mucilaginibacter sp.]MDB4918400.1 hypothetical protein [Mucilaginibacter sp.]
MPQLHPSITISNQPHEHPALDFNTLREQGIGYLQQLAGETWTDHNTHDPGITILDQLCYALTDLSYRINFDTKDLLAQPDSSTYKSLFSPATVLSSNPVTLNDFRKVLLDITGVKNAWIEKVERSTPEIYFDLKDKTLSLRDRETLAKDEPLPDRELINIRGLYRVFVTKADPEASTADLRQRVWQRLQSCRNLCEDFEELIILEGEPVTIAGIVELANIDDANALAANVLYRVARWLSPSISFYTLQEMQARGMRIDEIINGPTLQHGFIDDVELDRFKRLNKLYASDLIREIMAEPGVRVITDLWMSTDIELANNWVLQLDNSRVPMLDAAASLSKRLVFKKNGQLLKINSELVLAYFNQLKISDAARLPAMHELDIVPEKREPRNMSSYFSIQHHFPQVYGIGNTGVPDSVPDHRKAQAKQLKAYLLFFEQLLANYFAQVGNIKDLFSFYSDEARTYFSQSLIGVVPDVDELLKDGYAGELAATTESDELALDRKNRFLDHFLTRFSENLADYSLWLNDHQTLTPDADRQNILKREKERHNAYKGMLVKTKTSFLQNYPVLGAQRGKGFDHTAKGWGNQNVSGLEKRIAAKLGIANYKRIRLADKKEDGFHMVEHILLRPGNADRAAVDSYTETRYFSSFIKANDGMMICGCDVHGLQNGDVILLNDNGVETPYKVSMVFEHNFRIEANFDVNINIKRAENNESPLSWVRRDFDSTIFVFQDRSMVKDPYSFQLTFVFPDNSERFAGNFREFIETTIREETPAHLTVYIQWMNRAELKRFEDAYWLFLNRLAAPKNPI